MSIAERPRFVEDLGKYRLVAELARGGMGVVYLAVVSGVGGFNKLVVVKELKEDLAEDPHFLAMFLDEARLAARLNHPNVVQTNEVGSVGSRYFLAMEYLEGQTLQRVTSRLAKAGKLSLGAYVRSLCEVCAGLHYAHELQDFDGRALNVVHRDVSPHNVFVTYDGQVKVVDFGIAKAVDQTSETQVGVLKGKVAYMAPEQAAGESVDRRADVYSVGVMLWEAAAGRRLWKGMSEMAVLRALSVGSVPSPREENPKCPPELERIVMRALSYDRESRYRTAAAMQAELERFLASHKATISTPSMRALGGLVAESFADERRTLRSLVEGQLQALKAIPTSEIQAVGLARLEALAATGESRVHGRTFAKDGDRVLAQSASFNRSESGVGDTAPDPLGAEVHPLTSGESDTGQNERILSASSSTSSNDATKSRSDRPFATSTGPHAVPAISSGSDPTADSSSARIAGTNATPSGSTDFRLPLSDGSDTLRNTPTLTAPHGVAADLRTPRSRSVLSLSLVAAASLGLGAWVMLANLPGSPAKPDKRETPNGPRALHDEVVEGEVALRLTPTEAQVSVDGEVAKRSGRSIYVPRDGKFHVLRFEAVGHVPRSERVLVDEAKMTLVISLEPQPLVPDAGPSPVAPPAGAEKPIANPVVGPVGTFKSRPLESAKPSTSSSTAPSVPIPPPETTTSGKPRRKIDTEDPYR